MGRKSASGSGMNNPDHIFQSLETNFFVFLGLKYLNSFMRIRDGDSSDPGPGMEKSRIRDKHPGSVVSAFSKAKLRFPVFFVLPPMDK